MKASCSLWSADLLALKSAIDALSGHADEFHLDVMDGNCVPDILFGLDFVAAMRAVTDTPLDVHLMTRITAEWIERTVAAGAARLAIHAGFCEDVEAALRRIEALGATPVLVLPLQAAIDEASLPWGAFRRVLLMGTEIGIKGMGLDARIPERIRALIELRTKLSAEFEIFVDGGIRCETVRDGLSARDRRYRSFPREGTGWRVREAQPGRGIQGRCGGCQLKKQDG